jgi:hypothetical protein
MLMRTKLANSAGDVAGYGVFNFLLSSSGITRVAPSSYNSRENRDGGTGVVAPMAIGFAALLYSKYRALHVHSFVMFYLCFVLFLLAAVNVQHDAWFRKVFS